MKRVAGLLLAVLCFCMASQAANPERSLQRALSKLTSVYDRIARMYVDSVDMAPLAEEAIRSMVQQLDPHTEYVTAEELARFEEVYKGRFAGIGIGTLWVGDSLVVASVRPDGPAAKAGMLPDDRIVRVNGEYVSEHLEERDKVLE